MDAGLLPLLPPLLPNGVASSCPAPEDTLPRARPTILTAAAAELPPDSSCSDTLRSFDAELKTSSLSVVACELVSKLSKFVMTPSSFSLSLLLLLFRMISLLSIGEVELSEEEE